MLTTATCIVLIVRQIHFPPQPAGRESPGPFRTDTFLRLLCFLWPFLRLSFLNSGLIYGENVT